VLTRAIGAEDRVEIDHRMLDVASRRLSALFGRSHRPVDDDHIIRTLHDFQGEEASQRLIALAKENGRPTT